MVTAASDTMKNMVRMLEVEAEFHLDLYGRIKDALNELAVRADMQIKALNDRIEWMEAHQWDYLKK